MTARRLPLVIAVTAVALLTACEKPAPQITVASSGTVINVDASRYCFDECRDHSAEAKTIRVKGNTTVSFDVPKRVAKKGWMVQLGPDQLFAEPSHESHFTLSIPSVRPQPLSVTIREGAAVEPSGVWKLQFLLKE